jgi:CubicO group peptidase (beta-lactamase class C family)
VIGRELAWSGGLGNADVASGSVPDARTVLRCGSITKTFTATAIMQLRDAGKLSLGDPIVRHIPEFAAVKVKFGKLESITLRRLLTHHSGLVGEPPFVHWTTLEFPTMEQIIEHLPQVEVVIPQDSAFKYSNLAFALLGEVVTRVVGMPYETYVQRNILDPLGMRRSGFRLTDEMRKNLATGYEPVRSGGSPEALSHDHIGGLAAAGQLYSSVEDLAKWISFQFHAEGGERTEAQVLAGRSVNEMHRPNYMEPNWNAGYCLAWMAGREGETIYHQHAGGVTGFRSMIAFIKAERRGVVVLTNLDSHEVCGELALTILKETSDLRDQHPAPPLPEPVPLPDKYRRLIGRYEWTRAGLEFDIEWRSDALVICSPVGSALLDAPTTLVPTQEANVFIVRSGRPAGEPLVFHVSAGGTVSHFVMQGAAYTKVVTAQS